MKTFRILLQNGLTCDVVAAKIDTREWDSSDPLAATVLVVALGEGDRPIAWFRPEAVAGIVDITSAAKNVIS